MPPPGSLTGERCTSIGLVFATGEDDTDCLVARGGDGCCSLARERERERERKEEGDEEYSLLKRLLTKDGGSHSYFIRQY